MTGSEFDQIMKRLDYMERRFDRVEKLFERIEYGVKRGGRFGGAPSVPQRDFVRFEDLELR